MNERVVALIFGGGLGISASCARLFARQGLKTMRRRLLAL